MYLPLRCVPSYSSNAMCEPYFIHFSSGLYSYIISLGLWTVYQRVLGFRLWYRTAVELYALLHGWGTHLDVTPENTCRLCHACSYVHVYTYYVTPYLKVSHIDCTYNNNAKQGKHPVGWAEWLNYLGGTCICVSTALGEVKTAIFFHYLTNRPPVRGFPRTEEWLCAACSARRL